MKSISIIGSPRVFGGRVLVSVVAAAALVSAPALLALGRRASAAPERLSVRPAPAAERYPYGGERFSLYIRNSYRASSPNAAVKDPAVNFYAWMDRHYRRGKRYTGDPAGRTLREALRSASTQLSKPMSAHARGQAETQLAAWAHRTVKRIVPRFCLDHGFEFWGAVEKGERQCLLQSVLLAGMLQAAKIDAGVVMVSRNYKGKESNNGHATTLLKLASGQDLLLDASAATPYERHGGLMIAAADGFRYVEPQFAGESDFITGYRSLRAGETMSTAQVRSLSASFVDSQFNFYRAERTPNGLLSPRPSASGLATSESFMRQSVADCPTNPLAVYSLARIMNLQGRRDEARVQVLMACAQYTRYGWLPPGPAALQASLLNPDPQVAITSQMSGGSSSGVAPMQTAMPRPVR